MNSQLLLQLNKYFNYSEFRGQQEEIITTILSGRNTLVILPTGAGKSLCYQLPALILPGIALVISPLISLMKDQVDQLGSYAHYINSSLSKSDLAQVKSDIYSGITKLLYIAPESLHKVLDLKLNISFIAVDEAHCISEYGYDFRPKYREILKYVSGYPIIALTASATKRVQNDILNVLNMPDAKVFKSSFDRPNLTYSIRTKTSNVNYDVLLYLKQHSDQAGLVYCYTRSEVDLLCDFLQSRGINCLPYHAGLSKSERSENQLKFMSGEVSVIIATSAFGMGINKSDIRFVLHYTIPSSIEEYYQETGRAGRDGLSSECIVFYCYADIICYQGLIRTYSFSRQKLALSLLSSVVQFCETTKTPREFILDYFQ